MEKGGKGGIKHAVRSVIPRALLREREIFLRLGPKAGTIYARLKLLDSLRVRAQDSRALRPDVGSVLFICFGNIMRSPMAEVLFRKAAKDTNLPVEANSAGLHAIAGREAHPWALTASAEMGVPLTNHRSRILTPALVCSADAIFAMDFQNKSELLALYPEAAEKVLMLSAFAPGDARDREIADPYFGNVDSTRTCYATLQACIGNLTAALLNFHTTKVPSETSSGASVR
jgi:protein-tyrosine phosphatase